MTERPLLDGHPDLVDTARSARWLFVAEVLSGLKAAGVERQDRNQIVGTMLADLARRTDADE